VMDLLHKVDEVAYVRFASVYRQFKDINQFMRELKDLLSVRPPAENAGKVPAAKKKKRPKAGENF